MIVYGNDSFAKLLLHCDGTDASTSFPDAEVGGTVKTMTANGGAQVDTAQSKFGTGSALFDGVDSWISTPNSTDFDFGTGPYTIDLWLRTNGAQANNCAILDAGTTLGWALYCSGASNLIILTNVGNTVTFGLTPTDLTWVHIAVVRNVNTTTIYYDGVAQGTPSSDAAAVNSSGVGLGIGRSSNPVYFNGWIDEIRISKGIARWTANFTPPTAPYTAASSTQYDFPNPNLLRNAAGSANKAQADLRQQPAILTLLKGKDTFFGSPGVGPDYDWPNPRGYVPGISLRTWTDPLKLNLRAKDTFFRGAGDAPDYDWPNPRGPIPSISLKTWTDPYKLLLARQDKIYRGPGQVVTYDWPNPTLRRDPRGMSVRAWEETWENRLDDLLAGKDSFFGLGGHPTFDWPVPKGYVPSISLRTWTEPYRILIRSDTFFGLAGHPTFDWPVPKGYTPGITLKTWIDQYKLLLKDTFYGLAGKPNFDWPNPRGYVPGISLRTWVDPLKLLLKDQFFGLGGSPNFSWPNPPLARAWIRPDQAQQQSNLLFGVVIMPFNQFDWANPMLSPSSILGYVSGLDLPILTPPTPGVELFHNLKMHADTGSMMTR